MQRVGAFDHIWAIVAPLRRQGLFALGGNVHVGDAGLVGQGDAQASGQHLHALVRRGGPLLLLFLCELAGLETQIPVPRLPRLQSLRSAVAHEVWVVR